MKPRSKRVKFFQNHPHPIIPFYETRTNCCDCAHCREGDLDSDSSLKKGYFCLMTKERFKRKEATRKVGDRCPLEDFKIEYCICQNYNCDFIFTLYHRDGVMLKCGLKSKPGDDHICLGFTSDGEIPIPDTCLLEDWHENKEDQDDRKN